MNDDFAGSDALAALGARVDRTNELLQRMLAEVAKTPSTHAIFVDAGYLYAAAGRLVAGTEDRRAFDLDAEGLIEALIDRAEGTTGTTIRSASSQICSVTSPRVGGQSRITRS